MVVATERLGHAILSAEQKEAVLHFLSGQDVHLSSNQSWEVMTFFYLR